MNPSPSTRTLTSSQSGAIERTIPAHALPWPHTSPLASSVTSACSSSSTVTVTDRDTGPTSRWPASMPLSTTHTVTPLPVEPPSAHSRVTRSGHARAPARVPALRPASAWAGSSSSTVGSSGTARSYRFGVRSGLLSDRPVRYVSVSHFFAVSSEVLCNPN